MTLLTDGIDTNNTFRHLRNINTDTSSSWPYKAALEIVMSAGSWPAARIATISPFHSKTCLRCGSEDETDFYTFWGCVCNDRIQHGYVSDSQYLIEEATKEYIRYPCMWLRGILPVHFTEIPSEYNIFTFRPKKRLRRVISLRNYYA